MSVYDLKWQRILAHLAEGNTLTRFEAEKIGDHALNTTISIIGGKGIDVSREPIVLEGRYGTIHCKRYWLEPDERASAQRLLGAA